MTDRYAFWLAAGAGIGAGFGCASHHLAIGYGIGIALGAALATVFGGPQAPCKFRFRGR
jgi:hypothetical protein